MDLKNGKLVMIQKLRLKKLMKNEKLVLSIVFVGLGLITYLVSHDEPPPPPVHQAEMPELDEMIPAGFVLLPIDLINKEALASIMGATAVVDLLTVNPSTMSPQMKIASRVKLVRSPRNPDFFALLVEETQSSQILNKPGPYFAIIQNKRQSRSSIYKDKKINKIEISYQE